MKTEAHHPLETLLQAWAQQVRGGADKAPLSDEAVQIEQELNEMPESLRRVIRGHYLADDLPLKKRIRKSNLSNRLYNVRLKHACRWLEGRAPIASLMQKSGESET